MVVIRMPKKKSAPGIVIAICSNALFLNHNIKVISNIGIILNIFDYMLHLLPQSSISNLVLNYTNERSFFISSHFMAYSISVIHVF